MLGLARWISLVDWIVVPSWPGSYCSWWSSTPWWSCYSAAGEWPLVLVWKVTVWRSEFSFLILWSHSQLSENNILVPSCGLLLHPPLVDDVNLSSAVVSLNFKRPSLGVALILELHAGAGLGTTLDFQNFVFFFFFFSIEQQFRWTLDIFFPLEKTHKKRADHFKFGSLQVDAEKHTSGFLRRIKN